MAGGVTAGDGGEDSGQVLLWVFLLSCGTSKLRDEEGGGAKADKRQVLAFFDECGAEYPAESNVGREYRVEAGLKILHKKV
jgi:hypothetical protein